MNNQFKFIVSGGNAGMAKGLLLFLGLVLVTISTLVFLFPKFFAFLFAGLLLLTGISLIILSFKASRRGPMPPPRSGYTTNHRTEDSSYEEIRD